MQTSGHFTLVSCVVMTTSNGNIFRVTGLCAGNSPVTGEFPAQRPVPRSFEVFFDPRLNKPLNKQSWGWWFETPWLPLRRHCNVLSHCQGMMAELAVCYRYIFLFLGKKTTLCPLTQRNCEKCIHTDTENVGNLLSRQCRPTYLYVHLVAWLWRIQQGVVMHICINELVYHWSR